MKDEEIRKKIDEHILKTKSTIDEYKELAKPEAPDVAIGRVSRMDAINNRSVVEAALRKAEAKLKNLEKVKSMLGSSDFGKCMKCRQDIPIERILFRPESLLCVNCAR